MTNFIMIRYQIDSLVDDTVFADITKSTMTCFQFCCFLLCSSDGFDSPVLMALFACYFWLG